MEDEYLTLKGESKGLYKDKGSRFLSFAFPVRDEQEIKEKLETLRKEYHDARHHCYAWRLGAEKEIYRANDDGEPGNSAGKPILGQIQAFDLTNVLLVVVRYFGGTLLGVGGLIQAYKNAAYDAISNGEILTARVIRYYRIYFTYQDMNQVMKIVKDYELEQSEQHFETECAMLIGIRKSLAESVTEKFNHIDSCKLEFIEDR